MISYAARRWGSLDILARRLIRNVGLIVSGDFSASLLNLSALALTARTLGPELLGVLVMIEAYAALIDRWVRPETWQVLIKYGSDVLATGDRDAFQRLIKLGIVIDLAGALAAFAVAFLGIRIAAPWLGWDGHVADLAGLYCTMLIVQMTSTSTAVLRLLDRFAVFAYSQIAAGALRLAAAALAWWFEGGLMTFVLIAMAAITLQTALMIWAALKELGRRDHRGLLRSPLRGMTERYPRIWRFLLSANLSLLMRKTVETTDVLLVGAFLGPTASSGLHIAKRLSMLVMKLGRPVQQVLYPDISKLWANGEIDRFRKTVDWTNLLGGGIGLVVLAAIAINPALILRVFAGEAFADIASVLLAQMGAVVIFMFGLALRPALYSMEQDGPLLRAVVLATVAFYITFFALVSWMGTIAASLGYAAFNLVWLVLCLYIFRRHLAARSVA